MLSVCVVFSFFLFFRSIALFSPANFSSLLQIVCIHFAILGSLLRILHLQQDEKEGFSFWGGSFFLVFIQKISSIIKMKEFFS